ncbi:MAG: threonine/serine exporter family protein [Turicibacter sanguinis]
MNQVLYMVLCSMLAGMLTILLVKLGIGKNIDKIMIGDIMVLIPGLGIMTAFREILSRDLLAGLMRFFESILVASAIACGFSLALYFMGGLLQ